MHKLLFPSVLLIASFALQFFNTAHACSCGPMHPQDHYCRDDFVIKAAVRKSKMMDLWSDGSVHHSKNRGNSKAPEDREEILNGDGEEDDEINPPPLFSDPGFRNPPSGFLGSDPRLAVVGSEDAPEVHRLRRAALSRPRAGKKHKKRQSYFANVGLAPGEEAVVTRPPMPVMQYKIDIIKVYKGLGNVTKKGRHFLYSSPLCLKNLESGIYILMGNMHEGKMRMTLCDYSLNLDKESDVSEQRNLVRNLRDRFTRGCSECRVKVCYGTDVCKPKNLNSSTCKWEDWRNTLSMEASQFACLQNKKGRCKWYNALNKGAARKRSLPSGGAALIHRA